MLGIHLIVELHGVKPEILNDEPKLRRILIKACEKAGINVLGQFFHKFNPHGVTGIVIVSESHISVHTWPEFGYAALDIFTCGNKAEEALEEILKELKPERYEVTKVVRGREYEWKGPSSSG